MWSDPPRDPPPPPDHMVQPSVIQSSYFLDWELLISQQQNEIWRLEDISKTSFRSFSSFQYTFGKVGELNSARVTKMKFPTRSQAG